MIVVNLWAEPGGGKSTVAAGLFFLLKINHYSCEMPSEYAKELVWERRSQVFGDQLTIFSEQNRRLLRLADWGIDFAICDSPLPLPIIYKPDGYLDKFDGVVMEQFNRYANINYLLRRTGSFEKIGRVHDEEQSKVLASKIRIFMDQHQIEYTEIEANPYTPEAILRDLEQRVRDGAAGVPRAFQSNAATDVAAQTGMRMATEGTTATGCNEHAKQ